MTELADAVIVGGGILGAAIAWNLSQRGLRCVLLEAETLASGATGGFCWVNATSKTDDEGYHRLNAQGMAFYRSLAEEYGAAALGIHTGGALFWARQTDAAGMAALNHRAERLHAWGYPVVRLSAAEMRTLEPAARFFLDNEECEGLFAPDDTWIDTPCLTRFFAGQARGGHADIRKHCPVVELTRSVTGAVALVRTPRSEIATRLVILAAGVQIPRLLTLLDTPSAAQVVPLRHAPGVLVEIPPGDERLSLHRVLYPADAGGLHLRPTPDGGMLLAADDIDAALQNDPACQPPTSAANHLLSRAAVHFPGLPLDALLRRAQTRVCRRPVPADERPIVGAVPGVHGLHVAVTHSGVTLGPLLARWLADEITLQRPHPDLTPYRPARFAVKS